MGLIIRKAAELDIPQVIKMMVYGAPGMGKTTFALSTSEHPLLLDFDGGVSRVNAEHLNGVDIVQVTKWQDIHELFDGDPAQLAAYDTIVVDTVGKMMDFVIAHKCGFRQPSIRDWGGINQEFQWFVRALSRLGKNMVLVAHRDTRKEGDETVFIPALREKNYNSILADLDLLGYMEMKAVNGRQVRTVTFDPTNRNDGKNTCGLPGVMEIPQILDRAGRILGANTYVAEQIVRPYLSMLQTKREERRRFDELMETMTADIGAIVDADGANDFVTRFTAKDYPRIGSSAERGRALFAQKVKELGLIYDKEAKAYRNGTAA